MNLIRHLKFLKILIPKKRMTASYLMARKLSKLDVDQLLNRDPDYLNVVVSLTSIPSRLGVVNLTIRSLLSQEHLPRKIILWLHHGLKNQIPNTLSALEGNVFEIRFTALDCAHGKLVSSLECFPDDCIVTCDDDCMYEKNWLKNLYDTHTMYPKDVIASQCRQISYDASGELLLYKNWLHTQERGESKDNFLALGYAGVLYPPHCLMEDATNQELFLRLAPRADDLWFKAMSLLNGVKVRTTLNSSREPFEINQSQKISLRRTNVNHDGNNAQWTSICKHYGIKPIS